MLFSSTAPEWYVAEWTSRLLWHACQLYRFAQENCPGDFGFFTCPPDCTTTGINFLYKWSEASGGRIQVIGLVSVKPLFIYLCLQHCVVEADVFAVFLKVLYKRISVFCVVPTRRVPQVSHDLCMRRKNCSCGEKTGARSNDNVYKKAKSVTAKSAKSSASELAGQLLLYSASSKCK